MKIYISHSSKIDYVKLLYQPLCDSNIGKYNTLIFPHSEEYINVYTKDIVKECDCLVADLSETGLGIGIEIGWADAFEIPIIVLIKENQRVSNSIKRVANRILEYKDSLDLMKKLEQECNRLCKNN